MIRILFVIIVVLAVLGSVGCSKKAAARNELAALGDVGGGDIAKAGKAVFNENEGKKADLARKEKLAGEIEQNQKKLARLMASEDPFLTSSPDVKNAPESLNLFFNQKVYERLRGNFLFGYHYDEGFTGTGKTFAVDTIKSIPGGESYLPLFKKNLAETATKIGVKIDRNSPIRLSMCLVGVIPQMQENPFSYPGLVAEVCLYNRETKKGYYMRFGLGKKEGLDRAMQEYALMLLSLMDTEKA